MEQGVASTMILTDITPNEQVTIPRAIMKKLDIGAGSEVSIEVVGGTVVIKKLERKVENINNVAEKLVNY